MEVRSDKGETPIESSQAQSGFINVSNTWKEWPAKGKKQLQQRKASHLH
jgi:hypothetical protein